MGKSKLIIIGKTNYYIKVNFGKIPLEEILKRRLLSENKAA